MIPLFLFGFRGCDPIYLVKDWWRRQALPDRWEKHEDFITTAMDGLGNRQGSTRIYWTNEHLNKLIYDWELPEGKESP